MILRKIDERYSEVVPAWKGRTAIVIGGGPSLTADQVETVLRAYADGRLQCIAVNDAFLLAGFADVTYAADAKWHNWMTIGVDKPALGLTAVEVRARWAAFGGQKCSIEWSGNNIADPAVHILRNRDSERHGMGLSRDPRMLATGRNSGAQAVNLAVLAGAARILLLGIDGGPQGTRTHFHGGHKSPPAPAIWQYIRASFLAMREPLRELGVEVLNCSPGTAVDAFPCVPLDEALEVTCCA